MLTKRIRLPWSSLTQREARNRMADSIAFREVYPPPKMAAIIERERARSDRTGTGFSLLLLRADSGRQEKSTLARVASYLKKRLRTTDELGWLDDDRLCAVLSATLPTGAWKVAAEIQMNFPDVDVLEYKVYYYPSHDQMPTESEADSEEADLEQDAACQAIQAEPMEPLFVKPMRGWKRCLDLVGATTASLLLSPVLIGAAIAIRLTSSGPIFFGQMRSGRGGTPFLMYKFRSMVVDAEAMKDDLLEQNEQDGPAFKIRSDPRVTWVGRFLRNTSIDELPQLWNVLKGDMSLVGPRPLPCDETENCLNWHRRRIDVTPGMTCIWQLHGRSVVSFDDWVRMDISYIRRSSLLGDIELLLKTLPVLIWRPSGV